MSNNKRYGNRNGEQYTPHYAVLPIIKYLPKGKIIWCPFDTENSEYVVALQEFGHKVVFSHIETGRNFFEYEPDEWDIIVSNPPFGDKRKVFERCLEFGKPFALLMSNLWLNDTTPCLLFRDKELQLLLFDRRIEFTGAGKRIPFASSYYCWNLLPKQIIFENLDIVREQISRMYQDFQCFSNKCKEKEE